MHPLISFELATARIADLRRQARRDALARAADRVPSPAPQPGRNRILVNRRGAVGRRRLGKQLWTLLRARVLLDCPAAAAGSTSLAEDDYRRLAAGRESDPGPRPGVAVGCRPGRPARARSERRPI